MANDDAEVALGTDTGGSVRIPAACCGVAGLKTTNGRVSLDGVRPVSPTLDTVGPMASTVDGLVLGMQLLEPGFAVEGWGPDRVARVRLPAPEWIDDAIDDALGGTGWKVVDIDSSGWLAAWRPAMCVLDWEAMQSFAPLLPHLDQLDPRDRRSHHPELVDDREQYAHSLAQHDEWRAEIAALFTEFDLLVLPTMAEPVPNLDDFRNARLTACTVQANSAGVPAVALPVGAHSPVPASRATRGAVGRRGAPASRPHWCSRRPRSSRRAATTSCTNSDPLREYEKKRDFDATPEPAPKRAAKPSARRRASPRFVVQEHHARRLHWDLRLEHDGVLWSWAVPKGIPMLNKPNHLAVRTEDHPMEYLTFHGDIPKGQYGAGSMTHLGLRHLRGREAARRRGDRHAPRQEGRRQVRAVPDQGQPVDDPPHEPAH